MNHCRLLELTPLMRRSRVRFLFQKNLMAKLGVALAVLAVGFLGSHFVQQFRANRLQSRIAAEAVVKARAMQLEQIPDDNIVFGIQLIGSDDFRLHVARSLVLLQLADFKSFRRVTNAIGIVRENQPSGVWFTNDPPIIDFSAKWALHSLTWCAGGLAHETRHVELYRNRLRPLPYTDSSAHLKAAFSVRTYKDFQKEELECIAFQAAVLKNLRAPSSELRSVRSQDGTHFDVNRDGKWDAEDTKLQNW